MCGMIGQRVMWRPHDAVDLGLILSVGESRGFDFIQDLNNFILNIHAQIMLDFFSASRASLKITCRSFKTQGIC